MRVSIVLIFISLFVFTSAVQAKVLPQAAKGGLKPTVKSAGVSISVYPKLRADRRAVIVNFANLQNASSVSYALTYTTDEQDEGAMGGLNLGGANSATQELLFGTCSKNVCRYHRGIKNAKLEVSYTLKSGKKYLKKFKLKV